MSGESRIAKPEDALGLPSDVTPAVPQPPANGQATTPPPPNESAKPILKLFLEDPTKFTVVGLFVLYFLGFAIWHFYLSSFGVTSMPFLRTEYISAAFCFLIVFICFSLPPFLVLKTLGKNLWSKGIVNYHLWDSNWGVLILLWSYMTDRLIDIFLPSSKESSLGLNLLKGAGILMFLHFAFGSYLFFRAGCTRELMDGKGAKLTDAQARFRKSRLVKFGNPLSYVPLYLAALIVAKIFCNSDISKFFLVFTLAFWFVFARASGAAGFGDFRSNIIWTQHGFTGRLVLMVGITFLNTNASIAAQAKMPETLVYRQEVPATPARSSASTNLQSAFTNATKRIRSATPDRK